eukprot:PhF_6_TR23822/c0_g1_i2/m.33382/K01768/E4.6.1.1; adenylate cyclase
MGLKIGFAPLLTLFTAFMVAASIPMLLGILDVSKVGQDLGDNLKVEVAKNIKNSLQAILERAEAITRYNANNFRNGLYTIPDRGDPRGPEVNNFMHHFRVTLYSFRVCTTVSMTDWRGNLFGVYNNMDYTWAGKWESYTNATSGQAVLEDFETYPSGDPKEGDVKQMLSRTEPYNSSEQVWYTVTNTSIPDDNAWTPMYTMGDQSPVTMLSQSHVAYRLDGSVIGVMSIDMALGFTNTILRRNDDTIAFVIDVLMDGGVVIGASEGSVKLLECLNPTSVGIGDQCVGGTQVFTKPNRAKSDYIVAVDNLVKSEVGEWASIHSDRSSTTTVNGIECRVQMVVLKRNKLHWIVVVVPLPSTFERLRAAVELSSIGMGLTLGLIILLCIGLYFVLTSPIRSLSSDMEAVALMRLEQFGENKSKSFLSEVHEMQSHFEAMKAAVRSFSIYVPIEIVRQLMSTGTNAVVGMSPCNCTILFSDIVKFTSMCEQIDGHTLALLIKDYFTAMTTVVMSHGGIVDKFIGDAIMAVWGTPIQVDIPNFRACAAVCLMRHLNRQPGLQDLFRNYGFELKTRFGVNCGRCLSGNMGSEHRLSYTVIGDNVNLAARLEGLNKLFDSTALVTEDVRKDINNEFVTRPFGCVRVVGRQTGVKVYELIGLNPDVVNDLSTADVEDVLDPPVNPEQQQPSPPQPVQGKDIPHHDDVVTVVGVDEPAVVFEPTRTELKRQHSLTVMNQSIQSNRVLTKLKMCQELIKGPGSVSVVTLRHVSHYKKGMEHYLKRDFSEALEQFTSALGLCVTDKMTERMISVCKDYLANPPPPSWTGEIDAKEK